MYIPNRNNQGFSVFELLIVLAILGILSGNVIANLKEISRPLTNASFEVTHFLRLARSKAISQTAFVKVMPISIFKINAYVGDTCADATTPITDLFLDLPSDTRLLETEWSSCFTPRGLSSEATIFSLKDDHNLTKTVEIALGGGVRMQ